MRNRIPGSPDTYAARLAPLDGGSISPDQLQQLNAQARAAILSSSVRNFQQIFSTTIATPTSGSTDTVNFAPQNVGLIKGFLIELTATLNNSGSQTISTTNLNIANLLKQIVFTDLSNNVRINTAGWHLFGVNTAKRRRVFGSAITTDSPIKFGNNFAVIKAPSTIASAGNGTLNMMYYLPLAYSDHDLRGSIYANVVNATMKIQLVIATSVVGLTSADPTFLIYNGAAGSAGAITNITITVYQDYLDQLPNGGAILPPLDLSTIYLLNNTFFTGIVANSDFPMPYANFRQFLSTLVLWDNQTGGAYPAAGSDVSYFSLQAANFVNLFKFDPTVAALRSRNLIGDDWPVPIYYFDHREQVINTIQYGNMALNINASTINAGATAYVGYEAFAIVNMITGAGALPAS